MTFGFLFNYSGSRKNPYRLTDLCSRVEASKVALRYLGQCVRNENNTRVGT